MKNINTIFAILIFWQFVFSSCKKQEKVKNESANETLKFAELKVDKNFNWSTSKVIQLNFKPIPNDPRNAVLKVVDADGVVYFKKLQSANQKFNGSIVVPSHITKLKYIYGSIQQEFSANVGVVNIDVK